MSDTEEETPSIRQRHVDDSEKDELLQPDLQSESKTESDSERDLDEVEETKPEILMPRVYRGIQPPPPPPSFLSQQFRSVKNFFIEFFEFIMLFITTLVHPLADVNTQVNAHNQRRDARRQAGFRPPQQASFPFPRCGPSS